MLHIRPLKSRLIVRQFCFFLQTTHQSKHGSLNLNCSQTFTQNSESEDKNEEYSSEQVERLSVECLQCFKVYGRIWELDETN